MPLLNTADALYLGSQPIDSIYMGAEKVWPSGFTPDGIAGLVTWIDPTQDSYADGQQVLEYQEHSSAGLVFTGRVDYAPIFRAGARPYLECTADNQGLVCTTTRTWTAGMTFLMAGKVSGGSYPMMVVVGPDANGIEMRHDGSSLQVVVMYGWYGIYFSHTSPSAHVDEVYAARAQPGVASAAWVGSSKVSGGAPGAMDSAAQSLYIGRRQGGYYFVGTIYEVLVYDRPLPDADMTTLIGYLQERWL